MKPPFPADALPMGNDGSPGWRPRPVSQERLRQWAVHLFLVSLAALFVSSLVGYAIVRLNVPEGHVRVRVELPRGFWISSALLIGCGVLMGLAQRAARSVNLRQLRALIPAAWIGSVGFLCVQTPSAMHLIDAHAQTIEAGGPGAAGIVFSLIFLHALHVVGGLIPLTILLARCQRKKISPETFGFVRSCAVYWHFLEGVWFVMLATFLIVG